MFQHLIETPAFVQSFGVGEKLYLSSRAIKGIHCQELDKLVV